MPLDGVVSMHIARELAGRLTGGRVDKIGQPDRYALLLTIRKQGQTLRLLLDANPQQARIGLVSKPMPNPKKAPHLTMMLRKHLMGSQVEAVECFDYERVFFFHFRARNEMGDYVKVTLIAELMGRHSNLVLVNKDMRIIEAVKHIDSRVNRYRETLPAHPYVAPPSQNKLHPAAMLETLKKGNDIFASSASKTVSEQIVKTTAGFSPFLAAEVAYLANTGDRPVAELSETERRLALLVFESLLNRILTSDASPTIYFAPGTTLPIDFHAFNLAWKKDKESAGDIFEAMEGVADQARAKAKLEGGRRRLQKIVRSRIGQADKRVSIHAKEVSEGEKADLYKQYGDLLFAYLHTVKDGASTVTLPSFETNEPIAIQLDQAKSPAKNAERYYRLYRKAKMKRKVAGRLLKKDMANRDYLSSLESALKMAIDEDDLTALAEELSLTSKENKKIDDPAEPAGLPGKPASKKRRAISKKKRENKNKDKKPSDDRPHYRRYTSSTGHTIIVGRNNLQNDRLTLRDANRKDLWLHVHQAPGAHVIVQGQLETLPDEAILEAAGLAAWFSSLNKGTGSLVDVDYCPAGHVKKASGQRPGQVIYDGYYQMRVAPLDPSQLQQGDAP